MTIVFVVYAIPIAQPRQRHRVLTIAGRTIAQNYTPVRDPVNSFKASVRFAAHEAYNGPPLEGPIVADLTFVMPRPKAMMWKRRPMPRAPHTGKPDRDNLEKSLTDSLEGLLFRNDSQIYAGRVEKWIAAGDEQPHVLVAIKSTLEIEEVT